MDILELYCTTFGSKLAHDKTKFLMIKDMHIRQWIPYKWKQIKHSEIIWYLKIPFGLGVSLPNMWSWYLNRVKTKLFKYGKSKNSSI